MIDTLLVGRPDMTLDVLKHMLLPALALGLAFAPAITRVLFSSLLDVYQEDYIQQARFRGFSERVILRRHAFPNAIVPTLNLMGVQFGFLFGGTLLIEVIYSYPGMGNLMVDAVRNADLPIIQTVGMTYGFAVVAITIIVDAASLDSQPEVEALTMPARPVLRRILARARRHRFRDRARRRRRCLVRVGARASQSRGSGRAEHPAAPPMGRRRRSFLSLGTDSLGRCILSRLLYGARVAVAVAFFGSFGACWWAPCSAISPAISAARSTG